MLSRVSSFDDLATWEDSVSNAIGVDPLEDSDDPIEPAYAYVLISRPSFCIFTRL
jgi:hypothetical protein